MRNLFILPFLILFIPSIFAQTKVKVLTVKDYIINPVVADYIVEGVKSAQNDNSLVVVELDTPGGILKSTRRITQAFLNSKVPIIVYIYPKGARAASAGVFLSYASNILVMSPSTHIGAAHPVTGGGRWQSLGDEMKKKIMNDTLAFAKNIALNRNRPVSFIKDSISKSISITEEDAFKRKVCNFVAVDLNSLLKRIDGMQVKTSSGKYRISTKDFVLKPVLFTMREKVLNTIIDPNIAYMLLTLGFLGLLFEITHPGFGFPGIAGIVSLIIAFYALTILPVNYAGVALIALGVLFFIIEAFTPTFGLFTLGGAFCFFLGSIMLFDRHQFIKVSFSVIIPFLSAFVFLSLFVLSKAVLAMRRKPSVGGKSLIGTTATAYSNIDGKGKVFVHGEIWNALGKNIKEGEELTLRYTFYDV